MLTLVFTLADRDRRAVLDAAHEVAGRWHDTPLFRDEEVRLAFELRLDALDDATEGAGLLYDIPGPVVVTLRGETDAEHRRSVLESCRRGGARWIDAEIATDEVTPGIDLVHSIHATDSFIGGEVLRGLPAVGGVLKVASAVRSLPHLTRLERFRRRRRGARAVMGLGELGRASRWRTIAASADGHDFVYAAAARPVDPGQLLRDDVLGHAARLRGGGRIFGLIGAHTAASLSPAGFNEAFAATDTPAVYVTFPLGSVHGLAPAARTLGCGGFSVTAPHKSTVIEQLDSLSDDAEAVGAVNTIVVADDGALHGLNTDVVGVRAAIGAALEPGRRVLVVGAGGAARAALRVCASRETRTAVLGRDPERAAACAADFGAEVVTREGLDRGGWDVVVNATPVGGMSRPGRSPLPPRVFDRETVAFDMNYRPAVTPMLEQARARGAEIVGGLEMFAAQARAQWDAFVPGKPTGADALERAIRRAAAD